MVFLGLKLQENRKKTGRKPKENQKKTEENRRKPEEKKTTAPPIILIAYSSDRGSMSALSFPKLPGDVKD